MASMAKLLRRVQTLSPAKCRPCLQQVGSFLHSEGHLKRQVTTVANAAVKKTLRDGFPILNYCDKLINQKKDDNSYRVFKRVNRSAKDFPHAQDFSNSNQEEKITVWCSNDYLGMSRHPKVVEKAKEVIDQHGTGAGGTRNISGTSLYHTTLETTVADWYQKEAGLLFTSCYVANDTTLNTLGNLLPNCEIFSDKGNHASMIEGIRTSKAKKHIFKHNDPLHLEQLLREASPDTPKIVAFETVHSMTGDVCPLEELCDVSHKYSALTFIDEVHAVGLYGLNGSGIGERDNCLDKMDIISGTLGKAVGVTGGFIVGDASLVDVIRSYGPGFIFTTALPYDKAAAATASINILRSDEGRILRKRHQEVVASLKELLIQKRLPVEDAPSHIVPIQVKDAKICNELSVQLRNKYKTYIQAINYPTVPRGEEKLRIAPTPWHSLSMVQDLAHALDDLWTQFGLPRSS